MRFAITKFPKQIQGRLHQAGRLAKELGQDLYLVGGSVRDMLLGRSRADIDLVLEGDGIEFADRLVRKVKGRFIPYPKFLTATVKLPDGTNLDIATARSETYEHPSALPKVVPASINIDLKRRDFTINAMALAVKEWGFGDLVDPFSGRADLDRRTVRILHERSFIDDPTRLFRAVRFEQRLKFSLENRTLEGFRDAVAGGMVDRLSGNRLLEQLRLTCLEKEPWLVFNRLEKLNVLKAIHPDLASSDELKILVQKINQSRKSLPSNYNGLWILYLMALFSSSQVVTQKRIGERLKPNRRLLKAINGMSQWTCVEQAIILGEIETDADFCHRVRTISNDTMLYVALTHQNEDIRRRCNSYYLHHRHQRLSIDGETLRGLNIPEGPVYRLILDEVLYMKINGKIETAEEERRAARNIWLHRDIAKT